ncbi:MAG: ABC-2 transporter permease [Tissierellia bacterium]|nr:ABC-2 transporter permease [Tissierellia bacterium]
MLRIINKDLRLMLASNMQKGLMLFIVPLLLIIIEAQHMDWMYFVILISMTYILIMTPFSLDISNKTIGMINSLPISRREIVVYRYLSIFIYILISIIYSGIYLGIINKIGLLNVDYFNPSMIAKAIPYTMIISSIMFPANFKFEARIAQMVNAFLYSGTIVLAFNLAQTSVEIPTNIITRILEGPISILIAAIFYTLSMLLSIRIYENRDL